MKFLLQILFMLMLVAGNSALAQTSRDKVEALRVEYINKRVDLTTVEAERFWPVYNEYNDKIKAIRRNLRQNYRKAPEQVSEQEAEQLYTLFLQSKQAEADVHKQYNEKLKSIVGVKKMARLHLAEEEFRIKLMSIVNPKSEAE